MVRRLLSRFAPALSGEVASRLWNGNVGCVRPDPASRMEQARGARRSRRRIPGRALRMPELAAEARCQPRWYTAILRLLPEHDHGAVVGEAPAMGWCIYSPSRDRCHGARWRVGFRRAAEPASPRQSGGARRCWRRRSRPEWRTYTHRSVGSSARSQAEAGEAPRARSAALFPIPLFVFSASSSAPPRLRDEFLHSPRLPWEAHRRALQLNLHTHD